MDVGCGTGKKTNPFNDKYVYSFIYLLTYLFIHLYIYMYHLFFYLQIYKFIRFIYLLWAIGVLAVFCALAGAKHVYAMEASRLYTVILLVVLKLVSWVPSFHCCFYICEEIFKCSCSLRWNIHLLLLSDEIFTCFCSLRSIIARAAKKVTCLNM